MALAGGLGWWRAAERPVAVLGGSHHSLCHDGVCAGRRAAATKKPQAQSHLENEGDQKRPVAGRLREKDRPVRTRSGAGPGGCADVGWRAAPATATTASSRTAPPGRSDTVGRRAAPAPITGRALICDTWMMTHATAPPSPPPQERALVTGIEPSPFAISHPKQAL